MPSVLPGGQDMDVLALVAIDSLFRDGPNRTIGTTLLGETKSPAKPSTRDERAAKRALPATTSNASEPASKRDGRATKRKQRTASASQVETFDQPEEECERTGTLTSSQQPQVVGCAKTFLRCCGQLRAVGELSEED